jgi:hypothetical protein
VLRKIFGSKREEVTGECRKLHNEELYDLYSSTNIIRAIKSRRMRCDGKVARMGEKIITYRALVGRSEEKSPMEDLGVDGGIILRSIFNKQVGEAHELD